MNNNNLLIFLNLFQTIMLEIYYKFKLKLVNKKSNITIIMYYNTIYMLALGTIKNLNDF